VSPLLERVSNSAFGFLGSTGPAGAFESIATGTGTGSSATITFSSIPSTYQHLQLRILGKDTWNFYAQLLGLKIRFNGVSGSSYASHNLYGDGSTVYADAYTSRSDVYIGYGIASSATGESNMYGAAIIDIHDYTSTTKNKTVRSFMGVDKNGSGSVAISSGSFMNTSAVSEISIIAEGVYWNSGTTVALYGIKG